MTRIFTGNHYVIIILAVIMFSWIALERLKITSHSEFMRMLEDYAWRLGSGHVKYLITIDT
jgi:hypothetical protein